MKANKVGKALAGTGSFIGKNKMPLLYLGLGVVVIVIAIPIVKSVNRLFKPPNVKGAKDVTKVVVEAKNLTITPQQAKQLAEQLLTAFNYKMFGTGRGTDKSLIENVFDQIKTDDDFKLLFKEFGTRTYSYSVGGTPSGVIGGVVDKLGGTADLDLIGWLNEELDWTDKATKEKVRKKLPQGFILG